MRFRPGHGWWIVTVMVDSVEWPSGLCPARSYWISIGLCWFLLFRYLFLFGNNSKHIQWLCQVPTSMNPVPRSEMLATGFPEDWFPLVCLIIRSTLSSNSRLPGWHAANRSLNCHLIQKTGRGSTESGFGLALPADGDAYIIDELLLLLRWEWRRLAVWVKRRQQETATHYHDAVIFFSEYALVSTLQIQSRVAELKVAIMMKPKILMSHDVYRTGHVR